MPPRPDCPKLALPLEIPGFSNPVLEGSNDGKMRAYSSHTGKVLWEYDTIRDFDGVNGRKGHGSAVSGSGDGMLASARSCDRSA